MNRADGAPAGRCPLCDSSGLQEFSRLQGRLYLDCAVCGLLHVSPEHRLGAAAEREHYGSHRNYPDDPRYRAFLDRLAIPLGERLSAGASGLDYGAGPGPALARMLEERGFEMEIYDPFFAPNGEALERCYDFVTCTETAEHFFSPGAEFERLDGLLLAGGWLGVMTEMVQEDRDFARWRYARDPTHVSFYRPRTMEWIATRHGWKMEIPGPNLALFRKGAPSP